MRSGFTHRMLTGWISEFVNRPLPGEWPQIPLDDGTLRDFEDYLDLCTEVGYTGVVIWGFFVDRRWPVDIESCVSDDRRTRIQRVLDAGHERGLKIYTGLGLYSWGFDAIIESNPHLSRGHPSIMCPSVPESRMWMQRVIDYVMGGFDFDGLNMQSADLGRCTCPECSGMSTVAYHARLNSGVAGYIQGKWPGKMLIMDNWGCGFSDPADLPHLVELSEAVGCIIDHNNSAAEAGGEYRKKLIDSLQCPFGTLAGKSVWPPQRWSLDKWFLPITLANSAYVRGLQADGAAAIEQFVTSLANPSGEISLRFMGGLLTDPTQDAEGLLRGAVEATYEPKDVSTLDALVEVVRLTEQSYFEHSGRELESMIGLLYVDGGLLTELDPSPESYLLDMSPADRSGYAGAISRARADFERLSPALGRKEKAELTARCFGTILEDIDRINAES